MAIALWSLVCHKSVIDSETNNVSLFEIIEELRFAAPPPAPPPSPRVAIVLRFEVMSLWARSDKDVPESPSSRIELLSPEGETLLASEAVLDLATFQRQRIRLKLEAFPLTTAGTYTFKLSSQKNGTWMESLKNAIEVVFEGAPAPAA